jgi:hypothetical protein
MEVKSVDITVKNEGFIEKLTDNDALIIRLDRTAFSVSRNLLPDQARVGDFIVQTDAARYRIDPERTEKRRQELRRMTDCCMN